MKSQLNWNNKILVIEIQIIISIVRVSENFSKMLVLSGVFNKRILDATNYANQDYMRVNYTLIVVYTMLFVTGSQSKNLSCFCLDMAHNSDRWLVNHCAMPSIGQTWVLASIVAVVDWAYWAHWNDCLWSNSYYAQWASLQGKGRGPLKK
jgi:hypothetical protein